MFLLSCLYFGVGFRVFCAYYVRNYKTNKETKKEKGEKDIANDRGRDR